MTDRPWSFELGQALSSATERNDVEARNRGEVTHVGGGQREVVLEGGGSDHRVDDPESRRKRVLLKEGDGPSGYGVVGVKDPREVERAPLPPPQ